MSSPNPLKLVTLDGWISGTSQDAAAVPEAEIHELAAAVVKAHNFAAEDRVLTGYLVLYAGLLVAREQSKPWARHSLILWQQALDEYKTRYPRNWGELD